MSVSKNDLDAVLKKMLSGKTGVKQSATDVRGDENHTARGVSRIDRSSQNAAFSDSGLSRDAFDSKVRNENKKRTASANVAKAVGSIVANPSNLSSFGNGWAGSLYGLDAKSQREIAKTNSETHSSVKLPTSSNYTGFGGGGERGGLTQDQIKEGVKRAESGKENLNFSPAKLVLDTVNSGISDMTTGIYDTLGMAVGNPLKKFGWEDNPVSKLVSGADAANAEHKQELNSEATKGGKVAKAVAKYGSMAVSSIPQALLAVATAGGSSAAQGLEAAAQTGSTLSILGSAAKSMAKDPQYWLSFLQTTGGYYNEAKADGASDTKANLYALASGLLNASVEVGGEAGHAGIQSLPAELQQGAPAVKAWISSMVDEGRENVVQGVIERGLQNVVYQKENPVASTTNNNAIVNPRTMADEFSSGAIVGGILGGGQMLANAALSGKGGSDTPVLDAAKEQQTEQTNGASETSSSPILDAVKASQQAREQRSAMRQSSTPVLDSARATQRGAGDVYDASMSNYSAENQTASAPSNTAPARPVLDVANQIQNASAQQTPQSVGAADAGFSTNGMEGEEKTSRLFDSNPYNKQQEYATALNKEDYSKIFRYTSMTEDQSVSAAKELLYTRDTSGNETFLMDTSPESFDAITQELKDAPAWNGVMTDAAKMIQTELLGRSANAEISETQYVDWLKTMREHATATGQGNQAWAKWTREGNPGGSTTEMDAWDNLENSKLSPEDRADVFHRIVKWDADIEQVRSGDTDAMKGIVLDVAQNRGTLNGLTGKQSQILTKLADNALSSLSFDDLKNFAYASTSALSTDNTPANIGQKIKTIQVLNMLSKPATAMKNLAGNTTFYGIDALSMDGASVLDMALSKITGTRSVAFEKPTLFNEASRKAFLRSLAEITLDVNMGEDTSRYGTSSNRTFKANGNIAERFLSALERNQAYLLNSTDEFYKGAARSTAEGTQALIDSGKIKTESKTYAADQADQQAKYRTFQDNSKVSDMIQTTRDTLNMIAGIGDSGRITSKGNIIHSFGLGDIVAPFTKVAGNLVSRGAEYSIFNAARGIYEIGSVIKDAATGRGVDPAKQATAVSNTARGLTGTAIAAGFAAIAAAGLLRRADDEGDDDVRALNTAEGMTGTQLNLSALGRVLSGSTTKWQNGDTLIDLSSIEPLNLLMNIGTKAAKWNDNTGVVTVLGDTADSLAEASAELPLLQNIGEGAKDILVYGQDYKDVAAEQAANTLTASLIPNIVRGLAKGMDNTVRNPYSSGTLEGKITDSAKNSIPGLRETLSASLDNFGRTKTYGNDVLQNVLNSMLNPAGVNTYDQSKVSKGLSALRNATGDASFYPHKSAPSSVGDTKLTFDQKTQYQKTYGSTVYKAMGNMMDSDSYKKASKSDKSKLLTLCHTYASQIAGNKVAGRELDRWVSEAQTAPQNLGISTAEYISLYSMKSKMDLNGNGGITQKEAQESLDKSALTDAERSTLWGIINPKWKNNPYG